jgi:hypothetical protein
MGGLVATTLRDRTLGPRATPPRRRPQS